MRVWGVVFAVFSLACSRVGPTFLVEHTAAVEEFGADKYAGRDCRSDSFFIDQADVQGGHLLPPDFAAQFEGNFGTIPMYWFCDPSGMVPCTVSGPQLRIVKVLPVSAVSAERANGDQRFYRVYFVDSEDQTISVLKNYLCEVVARVRTTAQNTIPAVGMLPPVLVGRECAAGASAVLPPQTGKDPAVRDWHVQRVGGPGSGKGTTIVLLDTDVPLAAAKELDARRIEVEPPVVPGTRTSGYHLHGTAMAKVIRSIAERAELITLDVLDGHGSVTSAELARSLDRVAHKVLDPNAPSIVNLSLGLSPNMVQPALLFGDTCTEPEDGAGEAVRWMLDVVRRSRPNMLVVAAAGNQTPGADPMASPPSGVLPYAANGGCFTPVPALERSLFFPAQWSREGSCREALDERADLVLAAGAIDARSQSSILAISEVEPALVAPGELVWIDGPGAVDCSLGRPQPSTAFPTTLTGSSLSAAIISASAAVVSAKSDLRGRRLARWLHLTGERTCRDTVDTVPITQVSHARAISTFDNCPAAVSACLDGWYALENAALDDRCTNPLVALPLPSSCVADAHVAAAACQAALTACGPSTACAGGSVPMFEGLLERPVCVESFNGSSLTAMPFTTGVDRHRRSIAGPQPEGSGGCPDCRWAALGRPDLRLELDIDLGTDYEDGTEFFEPQLVILDERKVRVATYNIRMEDVMAVGGGGIPTRTFSWLPGRRGHAPEIPTGLTRPLMPGETVVLYLTIRAPGRAPALDVSVLRERINR